MSSAQTNQTIIGLLQATTHRFASGWVTEAIRNELHTSAIRNVRYGTLHYALYHILRNMRYTQQALYATRNLRNR